MASWVNSCRSRKIARTNEGVNQRIEMSGARRGGERHLPVARRVGGTLSRAVLSGQVELAANVVVAIGRPLGEGGGQTCVRLVG